VPEQNEKAAESQQDLHTKAWRLKSRLENAVARLDAGLVVTREAIEYDRGLDGTDTSYVDDIFDAVGRILEEELIPAAETLYKALDPYKLESGAVAQQKQKPQPAKKALRRRTAVASRSPSK